MHVILFLFYGVLLGYAVTRMPFFRNSGIRPVVLLLLFGIHVFTGCLQNWIAWRFFPSHGDAWCLLQSSEISRREMLGGLHVFLAHNSGWLDMPHNVLRVIVVILDEFTFHDLYIDTLLFSFPVFMGSFALFRTFSGLFPDDPLTALSTLLFPSTLFWTSCLYTEGLLYALTGWLLYLLYVHTAGGGFRKGHGFHSAGYRAAAYCLLFALIAFFRSSAFATLLPALAVWGLFSRRRAPIIAVLGVLFVLVALLFIALPEAAGKISGTLVGKQHEFQQLEGNSRLYLPMLEDSWRSFFQTLPWAIRNGLFEPLPGSGGKTVYLVFSIELLSVWIIVLAAIVGKLSGRFGINGPDSIVRTDLSSRAGSSFVAYCLVYALCGMLLVGMLVPFAGAIVRYRSIYLPFLLAPFLHYLYATGPIKKMNIKLNKYIYSSNCRT